MQWSPKNWQTQSATDQKDKPPMRRVYVFETIEGKWVVTVTGLGGTAPKFPTREAAEQHAAKMAEKYGVNEFITLKG